MQIWKPDFHYWDQNFVRVININIKEFFVLKILIIVIYTEKDLCFMPVLLHIESEE